MKLEEFLVLVSTSPDALKEFISDSNRAMRVAGLSEDDQLALRSGSALAIYQRSARKDAIA
jgi:hypothetical protein